MRSYTRSLLKNMSVVSQLVLVCSLQMMQELRVDGQTTYGFAQEPVLLTNPQDPQGRVRGFQLINNTDFYFGGLLRVHAETRGSCNEYFIERGVEEAEAMLFAIDSINSDPELLPNITLGYDIRDYCNSESVALDESLDWALLSNVGRHPQCMATSNEGNDGTFTALIGPYHSRISIPTASFLRLFQVPQISYAATSPTLNSRLRFEYYLRTVTPDTAQARLVADIIIEFGWTVVSSIHSNEVYGELGTEIVRDLTLRAGICFDLDEGIDEDFNTEDYAELAQKLYNSDANVVIFFALEVFVGPLLEQLQQIEPPRSFVWIATDAWAGSSMIQNRFGNILVGMLGIVPHSQSDGGFLDYYKLLTPNANKRDPYFEDYCDSFLSGTCTPDSSIGNSANFRVGTFVPFMVDAVYAAAHGLHNFLMDNCDIPLQWNREDQSCVGQNKTLNGENILRYISDVNFTSPTGTDIGFDEHGNPVKGAFRIINLQVTDDPEFFNPRAIGVWNTMDGEIVYLVEKNEIQFGVTSDGVVLQSIDSQCGQCSVGEIEIIVPSSCCVLCQPCLGRNYSDMNISRTHCLECDRDEHLWGNNPINGSDDCVPIEEVFLSYSDPWGIALICFSVLGVISVTVVSLIIGILFWQNAVIKSFGREQLILIVCGLTLSFLLPFLYIFRPSVTLCVFQQIGLWFSLTLVFAALLVKLIRVTRIFLGGVKGGRQLCIKSWQQVTFTFFIVAGQMVLLLISFVVVKPAVNFNQQNNTQNPNDFPTLIVSCKPPHTAMLVLLILYDTALIILINGFAIFTIRFPKNFNEARHIAFSTFAIGVVWLAFIPTYFATSSNLKFQAGSIALAVKLMAYCIIACLLCPRIYIAFRNPKATTTTTVDLGRSPANIANSIELEKVPESGTESNKKLSFSVEFDLNGHK